MQEFWIRVVSTIVVVGILLGYNVKLEERRKDEEIAKLKAQLESAQADESDETANRLYADGSYNGEADGFGGTISVEVLVEEGEITEINILSADGEDGAYLSMAENIIPAIIDARSAEVDTVSGATFSSTGIRNAVKEALEKAVK